MLTIDRLPDRTCPATFDIDLTLTGTLLTGPGNDDVTVEVSGGVYTLSDSIDTIDLTDEAVNAGWTGGGTNVVTGPAASIDFLTVTFGDGTNVCNLRSVDDPTTVNCGSEVTAVNVSSDAPLNTGGTAGIQAPVTVNAGGNSSVAVAGVTDPYRPGVVEVQDGGLLNFTQSGAQVIWQGTFSKIAVYGSDVAKKEKWLVGSPPALDFLLDAGGNRDEISVVGTVTGAFYMGPGEDSLTIGPTGDVTGAIHTGGQWGDVVIVLGTFSGTIGP